MKTAINWFSIPVVHFERAYAFYCFIFDKKFERISDPGGYEFMPFLNISDGKINGCINSDPNQKISKNGIKIYLNADGIIDDILIRIIPAGGKILMPKKSIKGYGFIAYVEDSEGNEIGLHSSN